MIGKMLQSTARFLLAEDPVSIALNRLNGPVEEVDVRLQQWAFSQLDAVHDFDLEELLNAKMRKILITASQTPFWKSRFEAAHLDPRKVMSCKEIARLPVFTRRELSRVDLEDRSNKALSAILLGGFGVTSGTTGNPITLYRGRRPGIRSRALLLWMVARIRKEAGLLPNAPVSILNINIEFQRSLYKETMYLDGLDLESTEKRSNEIYPLLLARKPEIIYTYPSNLKRLMYWLSHDGITLDFLKAIIYTAEHLDKSEKAAVGDFFHCRVYSFYGTAECAFVAMECAQHDGFHLLKGWGYLEIASADGIALPLGRHGRIVYTNFENSATPFIRYDTGDQGMLFDGGNCSCGISGLKLIVEGRAADLITLPNGVPFTLHRLHGGLSRASRKILQLQSQEFDDRIRINIVPAADFSEAETRELISVCQKTVGAPVPFEINFVKHLTPMPNGKTPLLIRNRKAADGSRPVSCHTAPS